MIVKLPQPPRAYEPTILENAFDMLRRAFNLVPSTQSAVSSFLLQDEDGGVWRVTVDTSGNLQTASVPLGQSGSNVVPP